MWKVEFTGILPNIPLTS